MRHRRHSYASEMIRLGVSLPALMQLLGHKDIRMTLRYVQVTQHDLKRCPTECSPIASPFCTLRAQLFCYR